MVQNIPSITAPNFSRLLPLEGGNNFRDLGGYTTSNGKSVRKNLLFRSGVMTSLTDNDQEYLGEIGIKTVVDFRSREELEIFPNHWAHNKVLNFVVHDYSFTELQALAESTTTKEKVTIENLYKVFPQALVPQLTALFDNLINNNMPVVINCSAGQDRTGLAAALILSVLDVPWETIIEDYHLSTKYRRPELEVANLDLKKHADNNIFADLMLRYKHKEQKPKPLINPEGIPHLQIAFNAISTQFGSVSNYLDNALGVSAADIKQLHSTYLE